jgi:hypothetical protein
MAKVSKYLEELTLGKVEYAWGKAHEARDRGDEMFAVIGMRAARARDEKMLFVLEKGANLVSQHDEATRGQTRRFADFAESRETTETQLWKEAYRLCDEGNPIENFKWVYGAAAYLCGYNL